MPTQGGWISWLFAILKQYVKTAWSRYRKLHIYGKLVIWALILFYVALGTFILVIGLDKIAQTMYNFAQRISHLRFGWMILGATIVIISFPPCIGHTTMTTLCGFAYGMKGFPVAAVSSSIGSGLAFIVLRYLFSNRLRKWSSSNEKWQALEAVVEAKGLPLLFLVRASPFPPWVYATSMFASIKTVAWWQFLVATFVVYPKIALHVFIGSRLASLADEESRSHMDTQTKIINGLVIVGGLLVAILTSWVVYRAMQAHIRHLKGVPPEVDELAAEALEEAEEGVNAPLLANYSSNSVDDEERTIRPERRSLSPGA